MIVVEYSKIELDYCTNCQGVWFDSGELELLLESVGLESPKLLFSNILNSKEAKASERKRKCPICVQKMKKTAIGHEPQMVVDACRQGDGLWFDGGEVSRLMRQVKVPEEPSSQQEIITFLQEVFKSQK